jgi:hypothetical protein
MKHSQTRRGIAALMLSTMFWLFGCDPQHIKELEEDVATEADVRARFGEPENIWETPGGRVLEYNRQPEGQKNYMITIGANGKMSALRQVLTPENFAKVKPGMPIEDVRKLLGKPARRTPYPLKNQTDWEWRWLELPNTPMVFTVTVSADQYVVSSGSSLDRRAEGP